MDPMPGILMSTTLSGEGRGMVHDSSEHETSFSESSVFQMYVFPMNFRIDSFWRIFHLR